MVVRTKAVASRIIGDARKALTAAAGANEIISKAEAKKLPHDLAAAVDTARKAHARVTVDEAVDAYASHVSKVLRLVDKTPKGNLTEAEAKKIHDPALRGRVLDVRAELAGASAPSSTTGSRPTAAAAVAALGVPLGAVASWHDSGDNGVESSARVLTGAKSLAQARAALGDPTVSPLTASAAIDAFTASASADLLQFTDGEGQADVDAFVAGVRSVFLGLTSVRTASGADGRSYLLGKARDAYVSVEVLPYSDG